MKLTLDAINNALTAAQAISKETILTRAALINLGAAKAHIEDQIKQDIALAAAPAPVTAPAPDAPTPAKTPAK